MKFIDSLIAHRDSGSALLATNFYNAETLIANLRAAKQAGCEVILQTSPSTLDYLGVQMAASMARGAARQMNVKAWLHLDHGMDLNLIKQCIEAGYDSVMIDASEKDFDTNVRRTCEVVKMAHARGIAVEAELGYIPKLGQADTTQDLFTRPDEAKKFVELTGVDFLAVAIGSAHGFYKKEPKLDLKRLEELREAVSVPLVLHGGSGIPNEQIRRAIEIGIVKINFATEIKDCFVRKLRKCMVGAEEIDLRKLFPPAIDAVVELVAAKMAVCQMKGEFV